MKIKEIGFIDPVQAVVNELTNAPVGVVLIIKYGEQVRYSEAIVKTGRDGYKAAYGPRSLDYLHGNSDTTLYNHIASYSDREPAYFVVDGE